MTAKTAFDLAAVLAVASAAGVVAARNPVHAVLFLAGTILAQAAMFVLLGASFAAAILVFVYAGGILVLFLFVVMLLGGRDELGRYRRLGPCAAGLGAVALFALPLAFGPVREFAPGRPGGSVAPAESLDRIARVLFAQHSLSFVAASALVLAALVAALVAARRP